MTAMGLNAIQVCALSVSVGGGGDKFRDGVRGWGSNRKGGWGRWGWWVGGWVCGGGGGQLLQQSNGKFFNVSVNALHDVSHTNSGWADAVSSGALSVWPVPAYNISLLLLVLLPVG